jgi:vanillate/3-O-methylgallate O-demethylase
MQKDEMVELIKSLRKPPPINKLALAGIKLEYSGWMDESMSWKETCYVGDWSFRGMLHGMSFKGSDALQMFSGLCVNSFAKFDIGQAKHAIMCNNDGKLIMSGILMRISTDEVYFQHWPQWPQREDVTKLPSYLKNYPGKI